MYPAKEYTIKEDLYFNLEWYAAQTGRAHLVKPIQYYDIPTLRMLVADLRKLDKEMNAKSEGS